MKLLDGLMVDDRLLSCTLPSLQETELNYYFLIFAERELKGYTYALPLPEMTWRMGTATSVQIRCHQTKVSEVDCQKLPAEKVKSTIKIVASTKLFVANMS